MNRIRDLTTRSLTHPSRFFFVSPSFRCSYTPFHSPYRQSQRQIVSFLASAYRYLKSTNGGTTSLTSSMLAKNINPYRPSNSLEREAVAQLLMDYYQFKPQVPLSYADSLKGWRDAILWDDRFKIVEFKKAGPHADYLYCLNMAWGRLGFCQHACYMDQAVLFGESSTEHITQVRKAFVQILMSANEWIQKAEHLPNASPSAKFLAANFNHMIPNISMVKELGRKRPNFINPDWTLDKAHVAVLMVTTFGFDQLDVETKEWRIKRGLPEKWAQSSVGFAEAK